MPQYKKSVHVEEIVGFDKQLGLFKRMLTDPTERRLMFIRAPGGRGKTCLLRLMRHHSEKQGIPSCMLDFRGGPYDSPHLTLARQICQELSLSPRHLAEALWPLSAHAVGARDVSVRVEGDVTSSNIITAGGDVYQCEQVAIHVSSTDPSLRQPYMRDRLKQAFGADLTELAAARGRVVCFFDSLEGMNTDEESWLLEALLYPAVEGKLNGVIVVTAGRQWPPELEEWDWKDHAHLVSTLPLLGMHHIKEFASRVGYEITEAELEFCWRACRGGIPLHMGMVVKNLATVKVMNEEESLEVILSEIMARAEPDVAEAIRFCAVPHWFNGEIIAWLRGEGLKPSRRSGEIMAALTELTFVGPYQERGWAYHENVRDLLLRRWRERDIEGFRELGRQAASYFELKAGAATEENERAKYQKEQRHCLDAVEEHRLEDSKALALRSLRLLDYPLTFRHELVVRVMHSIVAGESCSIVGVASTGKSSLLRFLIRPDVRQKYLRESWGKYLFLYIDANSLIEMSEWALYELFLRRIVEATADLKISSQWAKLFNDLYQHAVWPEKRHLGRGYLERGVKNLCQQLGFRLVFLFDEFDEIFRQVDTRFFLGLRSIKDEHEYRLVYVVATRDELSRIRENVGECESFYELFSLNTFGLGPYSKVEARNMVQRLAARRGVAVTDDDTNLLLEVSGRHPGLLRAAFWALSDGKTDKSGDITRQLLDNPGIQTECTKIWDSIGEDERMALADVATGCELQQLDQEIVRLLRLKGLVMESKASQMAIFCRLFEDFVNQPEVLAATVMDIRLDKSSGKVWVEGEGVSPGLTAEEFALLSYLLERRGEICSKDELGALYPGEPQNVDTLMDQLRKKIEPDPRRPKYIITIRGRGFKLAEATRAK